MVYQGIRVLLTEQLAQFYGAESAHIHQNYANNSERFISSKHFYKLEGEYLKSFKQLGILDTVEYPSLKFTSRLMLWTERGAARHAKILDTDQAWDVFEKVEEHYFKQSVTTPQASTTPATFKPSFATSIQRYQQNFVVTTAILAKLLDYEASYLLQLASQVECFHRTTSVALFTEAQVSVVPSTLI